MTDALPDPLVPADVDLRGLGGFMLRTDRLLSSELVALCKPEEGWAALLLWSRAWQQQPAASLPNDERILASFSGTGKRWPKVRAMAMRGFVLCSDNRWYHKVLAEEALEAWDRRVKFRQRSDKANKAKQAQRQGDLDGGQQGIHQGGQQGDLVGDEVKGRGREVKGRGRDKSKVKPACAAARRPGNGEAKTGPTWEAFQAAYREAYDGVEHKRNPAVNAQMLSFVEKVGVDDAPAIAVFYVRHRGGWYVKHSHAVKFLMQNAESLATEWARGKQMTDTEARQADQTAARGDQAQRLIQKYGAT